LSDRVLSQPTDAAGSHLATRPVIVKPEKRRAAQNLTLLAAVVLVCSIAQINWRRLALLNHSGGIQADRR
jgi:hypothetical protein